MDNSITLLNQLNEGQVFFFAGSGISYLSHMPSAGKILYKTTEIVLPQDKEYKAAREMIILSENDYIIQPEIFYETLLYVMNSYDALALWKSFSPEYLKSFDFFTIPNINHLFIVDYSVKHEIPIFTTNFDCLFEEAAKELGYRCEVLIPGTTAEKDAIQAFLKGFTKSETAYIFKLHGSVLLNDTESLETLHTTMVSITKINYPVINLIEALCKKKHITFVGYSGRDIDYYPEIKKRSLSLLPFWIDQFSDVITKQNCEYINAMPVFVYPNEIFEKVKPNLNRVIPSINHLVIETVFDNLQRDFKEKIVLGEDEKLLLLGLLVKEIGDYKFAYKLLLSLYRNNSLSAEKQAILLLTLSSLAHENSLYESCGFFAKEARKKAYRRRFLENYYASSLHLESESRRMLISYDIGFLSNYRVNYADAFFALLLFIINAIQVNKILCETNKTKIETVSKIYVLHGIIEHRIRILAMIQAFIKLIFDRKESISGKFLGNWLIAKWEEIRRDSISAGYSNGVAAALRFKTRINWNIGELNEGSHIYELKTYETGKSLSFFNIAEEYFKQGNYQEATNYYILLRDIAMKSGNRLNAIKGLIGIAKCNKANSNKPLLAPNDLTDLKKIMREVEGKNWQHYFSLVLANIENYI